MTIKYPKQPSSQKTQPSFLLTHKVNAQLIRVSVGSYVQGVWVDGAETTTTIKGTSFYEFRRFGDSKRGEG